MKWVKMGDESDGLKLGTLLDPDHLHNCLAFGHGLLFFLTLEQFCLNETNNF